MSCRSANYVAPQLVAQPLHPSASRACALKRRCKGWGFFLCCHPERRSVRDLLFNFFVVGRDPPAHCTTVNGMDASVVSHINANVPLLPVSGLNSMVNVSTGLASFLTFILVRPKSREES